MTPRGTPGLGYVHIAKLMTHQLFKHFRLSYNLTAMSQAFCHTA